METKSNKYLPASVIIGGLGVIAAIMFDGGIMTVVVIALGFLVMVGNAMDHNISERGRKMLLWMFTTMAIYAVMVTASSKVSEGIWRMPATGIQKAK